MTINNRKKTTAAKIYFTVLVCTAALVSIRADASWSVWNNFVGWDWKRNLPSPSAHVCKHRTKGKHWHKPGAACGENRGLCCAPNTCMVNTLQTM